MERGYVRLYRKKLDSDIWQYPHADRVFEFLMLSATYRTHKYFAYGTCIDLQPGQYISSDRVIAKKCRIGYQSARTAIKYLKLTQRITQEVTHLYSIYSILNWGNYQNPSNENNAVYGAQDNAVLTQDQRTPNAVLTQKQELKEFKEGKEVDQKRVPRPGNGRFTPPTLDEVSQYCQSRNNNVDPVKFHAHYTANGWRVGKGGLPMKDWKAAVVATWERGN